MSRSLFLGLLAVAAASLCSVGMAVAAVPTMTHLWTFDTDYSDSVGTYNGQNSGSVSITTGGGGMIGEAAHFDASLFQDAIVIVSQPDVLPSSGPFALSFWEKTEAGTTGYLIGEGADYSTLFTRWQVSGSEYYLSNQIAGSSMTKGQSAQPTTASQGTWNHHVVAYNTTPSGSNQMVWYVNGQIFNGGRGIGSASPWTGTTAGLIFGNRYDYQRAHHGELDEVATWAGGNFDVHMADYCYQNGTLAGYVAPTKPPETNKQVLHWTLDGTLDEAGGVLNGTAAGTIAYDTDSMDGQSLYLDGSGGGVSFDQSVISGGGSFSLSLWSKAPVFDPANPETTGPNEGYLIGSQSGDDCYNLYLRWENTGEGYLTGSLGYTQFNHYGDNGTLMSDDEPEQFTWGQWQHVALVYDDFDKTASWYLDGALLDTMIIPGFSLNDVLWLGNRSDGNRSFRGWMDDLQIYNYALAGDDVAWLRDNPGDTIPPDSLVPGDANNDKVVDASDAEHLAANWGATTLALGYDTWWQMGDFNGDHVVDLADASILAANWGDHRGAESIPGVPEPSLLVLLLAAVPLLLGQRRRA